MAISITRTNRTLVTPDQPIPSTIHELSFLDKIPVLRCYTMTLHVFGKGPEAPLIIREALSKALVHYHPLAGRLKVLNQDEIQIDCTGETGVWFVEASANCTLQSVGYFENVLEIPYDDLVPDHVPGKGGAEEPLVQMQVTQFACGGFVMGLIFSHVICDGLGAAQFLNAVAELARGQKVPTVSPIWHRDFIPRPHAASAVAPLPPPPEVADAHRLEPASIDISKDQIDRLKREFHELTGKACSTFEITAACFWKLRTEAIDLRNKTEVKLIFFANARHLLDPPLPYGFYGNCFFPVTVTASSDAIAREYSVFDVARLIQEAKTNLAREFRNYVEGDGLDGGGDPFAQPRLGYETLFLSDWGRLGFNQVDYGWGPPVHVVPIQGPSVIPAGIMGSVPLPRRGVRLTTWCVLEADKEAFIRLMKNRL